MKPNDGETHSINNEESLLEQVMREREAELRSFETVEKDESSFAIALVTMPDEYIINLYDYLIKREKKLGYRKDEKDVVPQLNRVTEMVGRLEELEVIQNHLVEQAEKDKIIKETVQLVMEKQKVRKMGPLRRFIYNRQTKKK